MQTTCSWPCHFTISCTRSANTRPSRSSTSTGRFIICDSSSISITSPTSMRCPMEYLLWEPCHGPRLRHALEVVSAQTTLERAAVDAEASCGLGDISVTVGVYARDVCVECLGERRCLVLDIDRRRRLQPLQDLAWRDRLVEHHVLAGLHRDHRRVGRQVTADHRDLCGRMQRA